MNQILCCLTSVKFLTCKEEWIICLDSICSFVHVLWPLLLTASALQCNYVWLFCSSEIETKEGVRQILESDVLTMSVWRWICLQSWLSHATPVFYFIFIFQISPIFFCFLSKISRCQFYNIKTFGALLSMNEYFAPVVKLMWQACHARTF